VSGGLEVVVDLELEDVRPIFGFGEGLDGLGLAGGNDNPSSARVKEAVDDGFGGGGVVFAGLTRPEADFEASWVRGKSGLVGEEPETLENACGGEVHDGLSG
jgi:hypothetical protein